MKCLPPALFSLLHLALAFASPPPALLTSDWEIALMPRHTLFLRQLSNLQTFDGALGGTRASAITNSGDTQRPFSVDGDKFDDFASAAQRSCDNQFKSCADAANRQGSGNNNNNNNNNNNGNGNGSGGLTVSQCDEQKNQCKSIQDSASVKDFTSAVASTNIGPDPDFPDFDLICEG